MPDFTCLDENLFAKVAQTLLQHISSTHCNFKSALGPSILLLCVRLADVQMNGFINYCVPVCSPQATLLGAKASRSGADMFLGAGHALPPRLGRSPTMTRIKDR